MELGTLQKAWIQSLRDHPERQMSDFLGVGNQEDYKACCLGELLCVKAKLDGTLLPFYGDAIVSTAGSRRDRYELVDFEHYGLRSAQGQLQVSNGTHHSLAAMNDMGVSWIDIADYIEANPDNVFTKSV